MEPRRLGCRSPDQAECGSLIENERIRPTLLLIEEIRRAVGVHNGAFADDHVGAPARRFGCDEATRMRLPVGSRKKS